jgi:hypothetical protein
LVATPYEVRDRAGCLKEPTCLFRVFAHSLGTADSIVGIGEDTVAPAPNLVPEGAGSSKQTAADGAFEDNTP